MYTVAIVLLCFLTREASIDRIELISCQQAKYDKTTKVCLTGFDYRNKEPEELRLTSFFDITDIYESCDSDNYCKTTGVYDNGTITINGVCTPKLASAQACTTDIECKSHVCVPDTATTRKCQDSRNKADGICHNSRDCDNDLGCSLTTKKCIKRAAAGANCKDVQCVHDYYCDVDFTCKKLFAVDDMQPSDNFIFCKSGHKFPNDTCAPYDSLPLLQVEKGKEFLKCLSDGDCVYKYKNGTLADVGESRCYYASMTETSEKYCRYGEGEDKMVKSMKALISNFDSESESDLIAYSLLVNPVSRLDLINPGNCTLYDHIKQKYGSAGSILVGTLIGLLTLII